MQEPTYNQVLQFVQENRCPFVTTSDVAEEFDGVSRRTINERLNSLHDKGEIAKRKVGGNSAVWFCPD